MTSSTAASGRKRPHAPTPAITAAPSTAHAHSRPSSHQTVSQSSASKRTRASRSPKEHRNTRRQSGARTELRADDRPLTSDLLGLEDSDLFPSVSTLAGKVLVLNGNYEPLLICSVEKALVLLYLEKAELVSTLAGREVRSTSRSMPFPSVIRLAHYIRVPFKKVILSRKNILRRDGHQCQYCGLSGVTLTVDHIMPRSRGGEDSWENLVSACLRCNNVKGNRTPDEAQMPLARRPVRPNHVTFLRHYVGRIDKGWEPFLFMH